MDRFADFGEETDWEYCGGFPWRWSASYEDGSVTVERITDHEVVKLFEPATAQSPASLIGTIELAIAALETGDEPVTVAALLRKAIGRP
jgi:hypothetical protein